MSPDDHAVRLAIRTVVVTTRAAVRTHLRAGQAQGARDSAARGLVLLDSVRRRHDIANGTADAFAAAHRELSSLGQRA
jgi:hypothetical protein